MKSSRINYVAVGAFVLLMIAGLVVSLAFLAGRTGPTDTYYTVYDNVTGVKYGTQVFYEGYQVGSVTGIKPVRENDRTRFRVALEVVDGWTIPEGSVARLVASGLLAAITVDIKGGDGPGAVEPGGTIPGQGGGNMFTVFAEVAGEVQSLSQDSLRPLLDSLNQMVVGISAPMAEMTPKILGDLKTVSDSLAQSMPRITRDLEAVTSKLDKRVLAPENVDRIDAALKNTERATQDISTLTGDLASLGAEIRTVMGHVDSLVKTASPDVLAATQNLRRTLDTVARDIDSITYNLDGTSRNMLEFSRQIRENPGLILRGRERPEGR